MRKSFLGYWFLLLLTACISGCCAEQPAVTLPTLTGPGGTATVHQVPTTETTEPAATEPQLELPWNMMSALDSNFELDYKNHYIMALESVEVKYIPSDDVETIYELNNELVQINAAIYGDSEKWVLVRYASTMDGGGNMGWVKISGLTEYTEENKALLRFPVTVKEGCKDAETGKELQRFEYAMGDPDGEYVRIGNEFGSFTVKVKDIVYPSTTKTTDRIWGEWEK